MILSKQFNESTPICLLIGCIIITVLFIFRTNSAPAADIKSENNEVSILKDSISNISFDMEEIVECIFQNRGFQLPNDIVFRKASNNSIRSGFDSETVFAYVSPLACWSCVKTINGYLNDISDSCNITYLIPENLSNEIQTFLDYSNIPKNKIYYISTKLGLPIENTNRVFLFTIDEDNLIINVFPPTKYSKEITESYINSIINN
jgi:hypothetical protein